LFITVLHYDDKNASHSSRFDSTVFFYRLKVYLGSYRESVKNGSLQWNGSVCVPMEWFGADGNWM